MNRIALFAGTLAFFIGTAFGADKPRGTVVELHSCDLYAGGCVISSQATLEGRQMLRVWDFAGGQFAGTDLSGLQVAVLQSSADNLAASKACFGDAVVYLAESATSSQRSALLAWLKSQPDFEAATLKTRVARLTLEKSSAGVEFSAGNFVSFKASSLQACDVGACGEQLWYEPRSETTVFTVAANRGSKINEPLLGLKWNDANKRSIFLARFGDETTAKDTFVSFAELCGPADKLF